MYRLLTLFILLILFSCSADQSARLLATNISGQITALEKEEDKKIEAEKKFYNDGYQKIREHLGGKIDINKIAIENIDFSNRKSYANSDTDSSVTKTLAYGRIRVKTERESALLSGKIVSANNEEIPGLLIESLTKTMEDNVNFYTSIQKKQNELEENFLKNLEKIDREQSRLDTIKKNVNNLAKEGTITDSIELYIDFGQTVSDKVDSKDKKN